MNETLDLYIDYLICSTSYTTATGLAAMTNNEISHDKISRLLSSKEYTAMDLWKRSKSFYKSIESDDSVLSIDDSIEEKPYTDESELNAWHFSHSKSKCVKGINFISAFYSSSKGNMPVGYELVKKTEKILNSKTGKIKRKSPVNKNEHYRNLVKFASNNNVQFKYVLNDIWFASSENMNYVKLSIGRDFIMPIKSNRLIALSNQDKKNGKFVRIDSVEPGDYTLVRLESVDFPLQFTRQVFKNEDGSAGILYLVSSDIELTNEQIQAIYKKRWKVETYHQSLKNNASLAKSPTKTSITQANHFFASLCAYIRLESISKVNNLNHFALKRKIYLNALKKAMLELQNLKSTLFFQNENFQALPA